MSDKSYGTTRYIRNVIARWPDATARLQEWTPKNSFEINETAMDENGRPIEEVFDVEVEEASAVLLIPVGFTEPAIGTKITITKSSGPTVTKDYVMISKERAEKAGSYIKFSCTLRNKQYVDYSVSA